LKDGHSLEDNIKADPNNIWYEGIDWMYLAQDGVRVAGSRQRVNERSSSIKGGEI
jgi:hypothetical protein